MDAELKKLMKKQFKNPKDYTRFEQLINETKAYEVPKSLTGELRPYQKIGY